MPFNTEYIGFLAGLMVASSALPQVIKSWRSKSTKDISIQWGLINLVGQILWILYGLSISSSSLIVMSSITLIFQISMVTLKIKYG